MIALILSVGHTECCSEGEASEDLSPLIIILRLTQGVGWRMSLG